ncbi:uncharacterized protein THITE_2129105 [Thermothielavioides terrestris NRRL 8126]|uniref:Uncharacterized protein n=1 Tax=Thermothielavioides terrestris (strain ATCC 38088 / NRRL 8126) TaxID=578455 RepID=G2QZD2_THETT|nr:uncharacterized protein THITE_2129105 [Thermothielavioides terrestris NRRL 8126]AEO67165.1 hypothetical protein THITE_2129105 [Thermothielavioides terrestris NRRL 8126]
MQADTRCLQSRSLLLLQSSSQFTSGDQSQCDATVAQAQSDIETTDATTSAPENEKWPFLSTVVACGAPLQRLETRHRVPSRARSQQEHDHGGAVLANMQVDLDEDEEDAVRDELVQQAGDGQQHDRLAVRQLEERFGALRAGRRRRHANAFAVPRSWRSRPTWGHRYGRERAVGGEVNTEST